jgi:hypothetical protein
MLSRRRFSVGISGFDFYLSRCDTDQITLCLVVDIEVRVTSLFDLLLLLLEKENLKYLKQGAL